MPIEEILDQLDELIDRFGEPPAAVQGLIDVALLRHMAAAHGIYEIKQNERTLMLMQKTLDVAMGSRMYKAMPSRVMFSAGAKPYFAIKLNKGDHALDVLRDALIACEE